jgi:hypothetical protein
MTPKQIEQINRGIAGVLGWTVSKQEDERIKDYFEHDLIKPDGTVHKSEWRWSVGEFARTDSWEILIGHLPNYSEDYNTRPQLLAALSESEKLRLVTSCSDSDSERWMTGDLIAVLMLTQSDLCKLFCAVKNIEIDL